MAVSTPQRFDWNVCMSVVDALQHSFNPATVRLESEALGITDTEAGFNPATVRLEWEQRQGYGGYQTFQPRNGSIGIRHTRKW